MDDFGNSTAAPQPAKFDGMPSLLIADDHPLFRAALRLAASESLPDCVVREAADLPGVLDCGSWLPPGLADAVAALPADPADTDLASRLARLTEQQSRVLTLLAQGLLNKQIADRLAIQKRTVKAHVTAIFEKLKVRNRTQAGMLLRSLDLGEPARVS
jgi:DNA-binding NarL/FixJ family response regulator